MKDISITENHPVKKRIILGPLGRLVLKLINWDIVGDLPDNKKIIIASGRDKRSPGAPVTTERLITND